MRKRESEVGPRCIEAKCKDESKAKERNPQIVTAKRDKRKAEESKEPMHQGYMAGYEIFVAHGKT